jgi:hypothetical protein
LEVTELRNIHFPLFSLAIFVSPSKQLVWVPRFFYTPRSCLENISMKLNYLCMFLLSLFSPNLKDKILERKKRFPSLIRRILHLFDDFCL